MGTWYRDNNERYTAQNGGDPAICNQRVRLTPTQDPGATGISAQCRLMPKGSPSGGPVYKPVCPLKYNTSSEHSSETQWGRLGLRMHGRLCLVLCAFHQGATLGLATARLFLGAGVL